MAMNSKADALANPADETARREMLAQRLLEVWSENPSDTEQELLRKLNIRYGMQLDIYDLRRIKRSKEFTDLQINVVESTMWQATHKLLGKMDDMVQSMIDVSLHGRSEIARVQAFRSINEFLSEFAPRRNEIDGVRRNVNVMNILLRTDAGAAQADYIDVEADEIREPNDFDEEIERRKYFEGA